MFKTPKKDHYKNIYWCLIHQLIVYNIYQQCNCCYINMSFMFWHKKNPFSLIPYTNTAMKNREKKLFIYFPFLGCFIANFSLFMFIYKTAYKKVYFKLSMLCQILYVPQTSYLCQTMIYVCQAMYTLYACNSMYPEVGHKSVT